jgi:hypothetical protein
LDFKRVIPFYSVNDLVFVVGDRCGLCRFVDASKLIGVSLESKRVRCDYCCGQDSGDVSGAIMRKGLDEVEAMPDSLSELQGNRMEIMS